MGIPDPGEDMQCDKDIVLGRKKKRNRLRDTEEVRQQEVKDKRTMKRDKEQSKVGDRQEISEILGSLTKKGGQQCSQYFEISL